MTAAAPHLVVVGAGHAAAQLCASLHATDWPGRVTVVGDEPGLPYHRPPLSKGRLDAGEPGAAEAAGADLIRPEAFYDDHNIARRESVAVVAIDRAAKELTLRGGGEDERLGYDLLVLATGSLHRRPPIPGIDHERVHTLRTAAEAAAVRDRLGQASSVVVIGAGFIGLEVAASLRKRGLGVTVLEMADRVLARVTSEEVSAFFADLHRGHGVDLRLGAGATAIDDRLGGLRVRLGDGDAIDADFVVVGAGAAANDALARDAGLEIGERPFGGVVVDAHQRTADPAVFAIGDCCNQLSHLYGRRMRLESVQNANDQAKTAAAAIAGTPRPHVSMPWFWSDQYDVKLQIAGLSTGHDRCVLRGEPAVGQSFSAWYLQGGKLLAVDAVNDPRAYAVAGKLIPHGLTPDPALIADTSAGPKDLIASAKGASS
ncbi:NAD(P)/FAD-dependent oxidoreductase [Phycisphaera mikurensis]|uniref:Ferredoxin reductase n=1 Tax=Phycisphaera mikurensis (strain NBRC 102666 / KCTC 22515 / FYK2301M01) TaxID=1142394 RepID=I0IG56_PHYMF|nr:FAD-dependent oxidoreductase [Phycisphaera mikurensis]MBB6440373.1 3-phenylpropionate/trans-cinnamate dioxygenase ferredoxin reductase subunit [Phycisphaera mikurensis]BAM04244.1 ferredoxin reductase [Phycisphaera mikurensis NBRC 102666]